MYVCVSVCVRVCAPACVCACACMCDKQVSPMITWDLSKSMACSCLASAGTRWKTSSVQAPIVFDGFPIQHKTLQSAFICLWHNQQKIFSLTSATWNRCADDVTYGCETQWGPCENCSVDYKIIFVLAVFPYVRTACSSLKFPVFWRSLYSWLVFLPLIWTLYPVICYHQVTGYSEFHFSELFKTWTTSELNRPRNRIGRGYIEYTDIEANWGRKCTEEI